MQSNAATVKEYLASLPADRRAAIEAVRKVILDNLDDDYEEGMQYGMIGYYVPHHIFPAGYHCDPSQPLCYAALASQKNYMALYLMTVYGSEELRLWFQDAWTRTGKRLHMGKSCIRFKKVEDLALDVIAQAVGKVPAAKYVAHYQKLRAEADDRPTKGPSRPTSAKAARKGTKAAPSRAKR